MQFPGWLKILIRPKIFIPFILTAALLAFALSISDLPAAMGHIVSLTWVVIAEAFAVALGYLVVKAQLFRYLQGKLGVRVGWRKFLLAYCLGEMTLPVPSGIYVQNYVLRRVHGEKFGLTSAATTFSLILEGALVLLTLVVLSIPQWYWLRYAILAFFLLGALLLMLLIRSRHLRHFIHKERSGRWEKLFGAIRDLLGGLRTLVEPRVIVMGALLSLGYLFCVVLAFYLVSHGVGVQQLSVLQAVTIYCFSLGVTLLLGGIMTQLGVIEVAGIGASQAWGYTLTEGLAMLLGFRIVWMGSIWLINGVAALALHREFQASTADGAKKTDD